MAISEDIIKRLADIEAAVKTGGPIDWDKIKEQFETDHKAYIDAQIKEKLDSAPKRRVPGSLVNLDGAKVGKGNRYVKHLLAFERDGAYKFGNSEILPVDLWLTQQLLEKAHKDNPKLVKGPSDDLVEAVKALSSTATGLGDELVPTDLAESIWMDIFLATRVADTIMTVPMPTDPFDVPLGIGNIVWRKGTQNQPTTHSDPSTATARLTTTELITEQRWSYTLDEDSIIALMPLMRAEITRSAAEIIDDFIINADSTDADTGNINSDDQNPPNDSFYLSDGQDGLRHAWIVDNTAQTVNAAAALADSHIADALGKLGKYAADPSRLVIVGDVSTYLKGFLSLTNLLTIDKFGPLAVLLTGQVAAYRAIPVITSAQHRLAAADGKLDAATPSNNTTGSLTIFHRDFWKKGFRRQLLIEVDRDIQSRQMIMVSSFRLAIGARTRTSQTHTAGIRNITV